MSIKPYYDESGIQIFNADCREVLRQFADKSFDLVLTDPPYGLGDRMQGGTWGITRKQEMGWDKETPEALVLSLLSLAPKVAIWGGNYYPLPPSRCWLSWFKPDAPPTMAHFELAWTNQDRNSRQIIHSIAATNAERVGHPTQKPLAVMKWSIKEMGITSGTLLDPFCGSGTSLVAAKHFGLKAVGIEISEKYCQITAERLRQQVLFSEVA